MALRLEVDLDKIAHNTRTLVRRLARRGISVTGVTKATLGSPEIARVFLRAGVRSLGDSRVENIEAMRSAGVLGTMTLIRPPMLSQAARVLQCADESLNTETEVIVALSALGVQTGQTHRVVLLVELGDLRDGIMPADLFDVVRETLRLPGVRFRGLAANLACRCGVVPDARNMAELSSMARAIESEFGVSTDIVSGGNSANLEWALSGAEVGRVDNLRLGEALLLGCEPLHRHPIEGLHGDAFTLTSEVIECKVKPSKPWGDRGQAAFGSHTPAEDRGLIWQTIVALGLQDTDCSGLSPPTGTSILGASSDHLVVEGRVAVGATMPFQVNYSALVRAMTSPFVAKVYKGGIA